VTPVLAFDIETVPDVAGLRRLHDLDGRLSDGEVAEMAFTLRRQATGSDFLPLHLHRVVAISCALRDRDSFRVWSIGSETDGEDALIQRFFDGIAKYTPQLVSWNGGGFDMPVLHYRGLVHGVKARRYWDCGEDERKLMRPSLSCPWTTKWSKQRCRIYQESLPLWSAFSDIRDVDPVRSVSYAQWMWIAPNRSGFIGPAATRPSTTRRSE
jgi:predicted PolB exonuclease-like 3'-5' exonuclease